MAKQLPGNVHFQIRLVKRFDGKKIVTHGTLAHAKSLQAKDKTLDLVGTEKGALQQARNYCKRGSRRKGPLPGEFLGVVLIKYDSNPNKPRTVRSGAGGFQVTHRPRRVTATTTWLYYVDPDANAYQVDPITREIRGQV